MVLIKTEVRIMKKIYKISYGNYFNFIFSQILLCFNNTFTFLIVFVAMIWLHGKFQSAFNEKKVLLEIITRLMIISIIVLFIMLFIFTFAPKKVIVDHNFITIKRYMLNFSYLFRGFNDKIYIKDIVDCRIYEGERYLLHRSGPYAVFFFDWNDLVEINTNDNKCYLVPIQNAKLFIDDICNTRDNYLS